jgi:hypothetical protein
LFGLHCAWPAPATVSQWSPTSAFDVTSSAQLALKPVIAEADNPFPWMSEAMDLKKEKNCFETRVIEYQNGGALNWD